MECQLTYIDTGADAFFGANEHRCIFDGSSIEGERTERQYDCPLRSTDDITVKLDNAHYDGYEQGYLQAVSDCKIQIDKMIAEIKEKTFVDYGEAYTDNGKCLITEDDVLEIINKYCKGEYR